MKYVSIDLETAGLHRDCSLLEFGAVVDDLEDPKPLERLPRFHCYIENERILGEPFALAMHQKILQRIANREPPYKYVTLRNLEMHFWDFLVREAGCLADYAKHDDTTLRGFRKVKIIVAGKNFGMFDRDWLACFGNYVEFHHRVLDPMGAFLRKEDVVPPSLSTCLERAGLESHVSHTAVDDALLVVKLLRKTYSVG